MCPACSSGDAIGQAHRLGLVVRHIERGGAGRLQHRLQFGAHLQPQQRIQVGQRLVHQQHRRLDRQRARHRDALALPAGKLRRITIQERLDVQQRPWRA